MYPTVSHGDCNPPARRPCLRHRASCVTPSTTTRHRCWYRERILNKMTSWFRSVTSQGLSVKVANKQTGPAWIRQAARVRISELRIDKIASIPQKISPPIIFSLMNQENVFIIFYLSGWRPDEAATRKLEWDVDTWPHAPADAQQPAGRDTATKR